MAGYVELDNGQRKGRKGGVVQAWYKEVYKVRVVKCDNFVSLECFMFYGETCSH